MKIRRLIIASVMVALALPVSARAVHSPPPDAPCGKPLLCPGTPPVHGVEGGVRP